MAGPPNNPIPPARHTPPSKPLPATPPAKSTGPPPSGPPKHTPPNKPLPATPQPSAPPSTPVAKVRPPIPTKPLPPIPQTNANALAAAAALPPSNTTPAQPSTPCSQSPPKPPPAVHAQLQVESLSFTNSHTVNNDTVNDFVAPHWQSAKAMGDPVCFTQKAGMALTAQFKVTKAPSAPEKVAIKGTTTVGGLTITWDSTVTVAPTDTIVGCAATGAPQLPDQVDCFDPMTIQWQAQPPGSGWTPAGSTKNPVYVTLGDPTGTPAYLTLLDISCRASIGAKTEQQLVAQTYAQFKTRNLIRKRDSKPLTYWNPDTTTAMKTPQLLAQVDASGQCGSWAEFLIDMFCAHGVTSAKKVVVESEFRSQDVGFLVKNWDFIEPPPAEADYYTHKMYVECVRRPGIPGQNNANPPPAFFNHFIVVINNQFYDPSYGAGPIADQDIWEKDAIDGLFMPNQSGPGYLSGCPKKLNATTRLLEFWDISGSTKVKL